MNATMTRDLTEKQFLAQTAKRGLKPEGLMGYFSFTNPWGSCVSISCQPHIYNKRRDQLKELIRAVAHCDRKEGKRRAACLTS